jgi:hypothetical protein
MNDDMVYINGLLEPTREAMDYIHSFLNSEEDQNRDSYDSCYPQFWYNPIIQCTESKQESTDGN